MCHIERCKGCGEEFLPDGLETICQQCKLEMADEERFDYHPRPEEEAQLLEIM